MKLVIKKKTIKIVILIIVMAIIVIGGIFLIQFISNNIMIKQTAEKISQINAEELETKIMEELKNTELYINNKDNNKNGKTEVITVFTNGTNFQEYITATIACLLNDDIIAVLEVPCFKINTIDGKFNNIEYTAQFMKNSMIKDTVKKVFKDNYNIDLSITGNREYNKRFNEEVSNHGTIYYSNNAYFVKILNKITGNNYNESIVKSLNQYKTSTFGIID